MVGATRRARVSNGTALIAAVLIQADNAVGFTVDGISFLKNSATFAGSFISFVNNVTMPQAIMINIINNDFRRNNPTAHRYRVRGWALIHDPQ